MQWEFNKFFSFIIPASSVIITKFFAFYVVWAVLQAPNLLSVHGPSSFLMFNSSI